ncbi:hypothetical protein Q0M94_28465 (plasmid) [Deinococcus radiomollis]|uniref:hypothetical protein n=1 Tax=Deinococcus radiomollis TaxID=468916 RepID=UPI00389212E4
MKPEVKALWTAALRSGEYQQGRMVMHSPDGKFCCLGVLCDVYAEETGLTWGKVTNQGSGDQGLEFLGDVNYPPPAVRAWAGLTSSDPRLLVPGDHVTRQISELNDGLEPRLPLPFAEIADLIEAQL